MENFTDSFNALDWAKAFMERFPGGPDEGTMIGWFANAIMRGFDEGNNIKGKKVFVVTSDNENDVVMECVFANEEDATKYCEEESDEDVGFTWEEIEVE